MTTESKWIEGETFISIKWHIDDVKSLVDEHQPRITDECAMNILDNALDRHDCSQGFTWDLLQSVYDEFEQRGQLEYETNN